MTDLDPAIWENETLGAAAQNENLERLTKQQIEDRSAKIEGREPREVVVENTHPNWSPEVNVRTGTVASNYQNVHFADEQPNDIPTDSGNPEGDAGTVSEEGGETSEGSEETSSPEGEKEVGVVSSESESPDFSESGSTVPDSSQEGNSTQWT